MRVQGMEMSRREPDVLVTCQREESTPYWPIDSLVGLLQFISVVYPFSLPICGTALRELPHAPSHGVSDEQETALLICSSRHTRTEYGVQRTHWDGQQSSYGQAASQVSLAQ